MAYQGVPETRMGVRVYDDIRKLFNRRPSTGDGYLSSVDIRSISIFRFTVMANNKEQSWEEKFHKQFVQPSSYPGSEVINTENPESIVAFIRDLLKRAFEDGQEFQSLSDVIQEGRTGESDKLWERVRTNFSKLKAKYLGVDAIKDNRVDSIHQRDGRECRESDLTTSLTDFGDELRSYGCMNCGGLYGDQLQFMKHLLEQDK